MGRILLSICAVVVAAGLSGLQQPDQASGEEQAQAASTGSAGQPNRAIPPHRLPVLQDPGCRRGQDNRGSDLCAQWKAADAAGSSADAAWYLGILGLCIGGLTLWAASRAAHWAKEAAKETKRGADIADKAFNSLERPYLVLEIVESGVVKKGKATTFGPVKYRFQNLGRTPAILTRQKLDYRRTDGLPTPIDPLDVDGDQIAYGQAIGAGDYSRPFETGPAMSILSLFAQQQAGEKRGDILFLLGFIKYRSLAGSEYATGFCFGHDDATDFHLASPRLRPGEEDPYNYDRRLS